jgi:hypothetical protein
MPDNTRRKLLFITNRDLLLIAIGKAQLIGVPPGSSILAAYFNHARDGFDFVLINMGFPEVAQGVQLEYIETTTEITR